MAMGCITYVDPLLGIQQGLSGFLSKAAGVGGGGLRQSSWRFFSATQDIGKEDSLEVLPGQDGGRTLLPHAMIQRVVWGQGGMLTRN